MIFPVTVTVEWQVGEAQWRLDVAAGPWRDPGGEELLDRYDRSTLRHIVSMAQQHGLKLDAGRAGT